MKAGISILKFFYHLRIAGEYALDFTRDYPKSVFTKMLEKFTIEIQLMFNYSIKNFNIKKYAPDTIELIKSKWYSDVFAETEISRKMTLLNDDQKEFLELIIDQILNGEKIETEFKQKIA